MDTVAGGAVMLSRQPVLLLLEVSSNIMMVSKKDHVVVMGGRKAGVTHTIPSFFSLRDSREQVSYNLAECYDLE